MKEELVSAFEREYLADLLARLPDFSLAGAGPWTPRRAFHVHGPSRQPIRFTPGPRAAT